ncbi:hypothetical protein LX36DRAFT_51794 [Colletotrichum falcatum]|nr:hypothetical protein LX36DRAFT_51794 [Colletotrichum falcatum]
MVQSANFKVQMTKKVLDDRWDNDKVYFAVKVEYSLGVARIQFGQGAHVRLCFRAASVLINPSHEDDAIGCRRETGVWGGGTMRKWDRVDKRKERCSWKPGRVDERKTV